MKPLTDEQEAAANHVGSVLVTACPGSGKTRVLTYRIVKGLQELQSPKHRVIAMTFTNRAADELQLRLDQLSVDASQLWAGTIHGFALEWIIRPYAPYRPELQHGFSVADEFFTDHLLRELRKEFDAPYYLDVDTSWTRDGKLKNWGDPVAQGIAVEYKRRIHASKLIDYDDILYHAFRLVTENTEIACTLNAIFRLFCIDESQDTQDLQYGILSRIVKASKEPPTMFFVGDLDQSIYESLGSQPKTAAEISKELGVSVATLHLTGNYRSTQRIIDYCTLLRPQPSRIQSLAKYKNETGLITYANHTVSTDGLAKLVAKIIRNSLAANVKPDDICVLAPHWRHVRSLGRSLVPLLPEIGFNAPGLSPLHAQRENIWFKLSRLMLTQPTPPLYVTRMRWTGELIRDFYEHGVTCPDAVSSSRQLLRFINSIAPPHDDGIEFLENAFDQFAQGIGLQIESHTILSQSHASFFTKAKERIEELGDDTLSDISSFRRLFRQPAGVGISTCHAVKGEEYDTVVAVSLLEGYVPNWRVINHGTAKAAYDESSKLLYVIASRAKKRLHLVSETGHFTKKKKPYEPSKVLSGLRFSYDVT